MGSCQGIRVKNVHKSAEKEKITGIEYNRMANETALVIGKPIVSKTELITTEKDHPMATYVFPRNVTL